MKKKLSFVFLIFFFAASVQSNESEIVFSQSFSRNNPVPLNQLETFEAVHGPAVLKILNGIFQNSECEKVDSAIITFNGMAIAKASDFKNKVAIIEKLVVLNHGTNSLAVNLKGKLGGGITVIILQEPELIENLPVSGGDVTVDDPDSPISGTKVEISEDSIPEDSEEEEIIIVIKATEPPAELDEDLYQAGTTVNVESNIETFSKPIKLTIPYNDKNDDGAIDGTSLPESNVKVAYFNESTQVWENVPVMVRNLVENTVTIETEHFSNYVAFVSKYAPPMTITSPVPSGKTITVDGNPNDWYDAGILPYGEDGKSDWVSDSVLSLTDRDNYDIKNIYTAIDANYAYLMIETYGGIFPDDALLDLAINLAPGENYWLPFADLGITSHRNDVNSDIYIYKNSTEGYWTNSVVAKRANVFELSIPLSVIQNFTGEYGGYFNVINANLYYTPFTIMEDWNDLCDQYWFGSHLYTYLFHREFESGESRYELGVELRVENSVVEENVLTEVTLYGPLEGVATLKTFSVAEDATYSSYPYLFGRWDDNQNKFTYSEIPNTNIWMYPSSLEKGTYLVTALDEFGNLFEKEHYFSGLKTLPLVAVDDIIKFFDVDGNLHCYWESPNILKESPNENIGSSRIILNAKDTEGETLYSITTSVPINKAMAIIPAQLLDLMNAQEGTDHIEIVFQTRSADNCNRYQSYPIDLSAVGTAPSDWEAPYDDDWSIDGIDQTRWYPRYWDYPTSLGIFDNKIIVSTKTEGQGEVSYFSKFNLSGDFDVQIDYAVTKWPNGGRGQLLFQVGFGGNSPRVMIGMLRRRDQGYIGDTRYYFSAFYTGYPPLIGATSFWDLSDFIPTEDLTGKFRITRTGNLIKTYYYDPSHETAVDDWVNLGTFDYEGDYLGSNPVNLILNNYRNVYPEVIDIEAEFSNFKINSD